jgi:hypothetical protein
MGKKGGPNILTLALVGGALFLGYQYMTNRGGEHDYISKIIGDKAFSGYVRGNVNWGGGIDYTPYLGGYY